MQYILGADRTQAVLFLQSLDEIIDQNNEVRISNGALFCKHEKRASVDVGLMFTAINLRRLIIISIKICSKSS